jgi:hypothetical protein
MPETNSSDLQKFLSANFKKGKLSKEQYDQMIEDSRSLDLRQFTDKYDDVLKEKSVGWSKIRKPKEKDLSERLREDFGDAGFNPSENWKDEIYFSKYKDVPRDKFEKTLSNMRQFYQDELAEREKIGGVARRTKEVKEWPWYWNFASSDYEKQRYINEPEKALFGKEAPDLGEAKETRGEALADLGLGAAAVGADIGTGLLAPGVGSFIAGAVTGPAIRGIRDVYHNVGDSDYKKDWSDVGSEFKNDIFSNLAIQALPNWRSLKRGFGNTTSEIGDRAVDLALKNEDNLRTMKQSLESFPVITELPEMKNSDILRRIYSLPEGPLKDNLKKYAPDIMSVDRAGIADEIKRGRIYVDLAENPSIREGMTNFNELRDYYYRTKPGSKEFQEETEKLLEETNKKLENKLGAKDFGTRQYESELLEEVPLTRSQKLFKTARKAQGPIMGGSTSTIKAGAVAKRKEKAEYSNEAQKDWFKQNYARDWELGFSPEFKDGDPKWEAFAELYPERALEIMTRGNVTPSIKSIYKK